jgi:hypothetical protein
MSWSHCTLRLFVFTYHIRRQWTSGAYSTLLNKQKWVSWNLTQQTLIWNKQPQTSVMCHHNTDTCETIKNDTQSYFKCGLTFLENDSATREESAKLCGYIISLNVNVSH